MLLYKKSLNNRTLTVLFDYRIYIHNPLITNNIFKSFQTVKLKSIPNNLSIDVCFWTDDSILNSLKSIYALHIHNINQTNLFLSILDELKFYCYYFLCSLSLHGSGCVLSDKSLLFLGSRMTGKTTLVNDLLPLPTARFIDDDCINIMDDGKIACFGMPLLLRIGCPNSSYCEKDSDGTMRFFSFSDMLKDVESKVDFVFFPVYDKDSYSASRLLSKNDFINRTMKNIKHCRSNDIIIPVLNKIFFAAKPYSLSYSSSSEAIEIIQGLIDY